MLKYSSLIVLSFMLCQLHLAYCLDCYQCSTVQNVTECHTVGQCPSTEQHCRTITFSNGTVTLGCATAEQCHVSTTVAPTTSTLATAPTTASATTMSNATSASINTTPGSLTTVNATGTTAMPFHVPTTPIPTTPPTRNTTTKSKGPDPSASSTTGAPTKSNGTDPSLVGRSVYRRTDATVECDTCCTTDACNKKLCAVPEKHNTTNSTEACFDQQGEDFCKTAIQFINLCDDVQRAKNTCKYSCDLCNLVDGGWSEWGNWSACHLTCGNSTRFRERDCNNPKPASGGLECEGNKTEEATCNDRLCPVDGEWTTWSDWSTCSVTCGTGLQRRDRNCSNPMPDADGEHCFGDSRDDRLCHRTACESAFLVTGAPSNDRNEAIVLPNVITNIGGDYDNATGKFNCSISGIYEFHVMIEKQRNHTEAHCSLLRNDVITISLRAASDVGQPLTASNTAVLHLTPGDVIYLGRCSDVTSLTEETTFTGVLVQSD